MKKRKQSLWSLFCLILLLIVLFGILAVRMQSPASDSAEETMPPESTEALAVAEESISSPVPVSSADSIVSPAPEEKADILPIEEPTTSNYGQMIAPSLYDPYELPEGSAAAAPSLPGENETEEVPFPAG